MTAQQINTESAATVTAYDVVVQNSGPNYNYHALLAAAGTTKPMFRTGMLSISNMEEGNQNKLDVRTKTPIKRVWMSYDLTLELEHRGADQFVDYRDGRTIDILGGVQILIPEAYLDQILDAADRSDEGYIELAVQAQRGAPSFTYKGIILNGNTNLPYLPLVQYEGRAGLTQAEAREGLVAGAAANGSASNLGAKATGKLAKFAALFGS